MSFSRIDRVQNLLKAEIARVIDQELDNPLLPPFITIYGVKVSKDLHYATALVTFLADETEAERESTVKELNKSSGYIGRIVAQRVQLRRHPRIRFVYNASTRYALDMESFFQKIHDELANSPNNAPAPNEAADAENESGGPSSEEE